MCSRVRGLPARPFSLYDVTPSPHRQTLPLVNSDPFSRRRFYFDSRGYRHCRSLYTLRFSRHSASEESHMLSVDWHGHAHAAGVASSNAARLCVSLGLTLAILQSKWFILPDCKSSTCPNSFYPEAVSHGIRGHASCDGWIFPSNTAPLSPTELNRVIDKRLRRH